MTPEEKEMQEIASYDIEAKHHKADKLLCKLLRLLGYDKGVEIFENMTKWYS